MADLGKLMKVLQVQVKIKMRSAVTNLSEKALQKAVDNVPGKDNNSHMADNIINSKFLDDKGNHIQFGFRHPDADALEHGRNPQSFSGSYTQNVKQHTRKTKTGTVNVRKQKRVYKNHRPTLTKDGWRMVTESPQIKASKWLEKSADKVFKDEQLLAAEIKKSLEK